MIQLQESRLIVFLTIFFLAILIQICSVDNSGGEQMRTLRPCREQLPRFSLLKIKIYRIMSPHLATSKTIKQNIPAEHVSISREQTRLYRLRNTDYIYFNSHHLFEPKTLGARVGTR